MPVKVETDNWVCVFRDQIKDSIAEGDQWFVTNYKGKMRLQVREDGKIATRILPFEWNKKETPKALQRIREIYKNYSLSKGEKTLAKACEVSAASSSTQKIEWTELTDQYRKFVPNASDRTWKKYYVPVLVKAGHIYSLKKKPADGEALMMRSLTQWEQGSRSRQIARRSLKGFLEWAVMRGKLPAAYAPPASIPEIKKPKRIGFALTDSQILRLLDDISDERWKFAIQLCAVYGLRPEELRHLRIKDGVEGKELWTIYQKSMGGTKGDKTKPRRLHPLLIEDMDGNTIDWKLQQRLEIGESLPPLGQKGKGGEALRTHLRRKNVWNVLCKEAEMIGEVLVPYTFRHRYAKASHAAGIPLTNIAAAMGHTTEVHHQSYARFIPDGTADLYAKRNARVA
jgi:integrase